MRSIAEDYLEQCGGFHDASGGLSLSNIKDSEQCGGLINVNSHNMISYTLRNNPHNRPFQMRSHLRFART